MIFCVDCDYREAVTIDDRYCGKCLHKRIMADSPLSDWRTTKYRREAFGMIGRTVQDTLSFSETPTGVWGIEEIEGIEADGWQGWARL